MNALPSHLFEQVPGRLTDIGDNPFETVMIMRCRYCAKTASKAREDGCVMRELDEAGHILLSLFNPEGMMRFADRSCVTCHLPIMDHYLRRGQREYYCDRLGQQVSDGVSDCVWDVKDVHVPDEVSAPESNQSSQQSDIDTH